jgi:phage/plasmid-like protein (TIGR03299 family)
MAHEIANVNGKDSIAYVGEKPWHGLGQELTENASLETWRVEAGMNWDILSAPVTFSTDNSTPSTFSGKQVLYRSDTKEELSIVSEKFHVVQPGEVLDFFKDLVSLQGMKLTTAGVLFGGTRFWAMAETNKVLKLNGKDEVKLNLLLATSCDGSLATNGIYTSVRTVCNNTLSMALGDNVQRVKMSHRSTFNPLKMKGSLGLVDDSWERFRTSIETLASTKITDKDAEKFVLNLLKVPDLADSDQPYTVQKNTNSIMNLYKNGMGSDMSYGTRWGILNGVTEFVDHHGRARTADTSLWSSWYGKGADLKSDAFEQLVETI